MLFDLYSDKSIKLFCRDFMNANLLYYFILLVCFCIHSIISCPLLLSSYFIYTAFKCVVEL